MSTAPVPNSPEGDEFLSRYRRQPPTATAERLAANLVAALEAIRATYAPLVEKSTASVRAGHGYDVAESVLHDLMHFYNAGDDWLRLHGINSVDASDGLSSMVIGIVDSTTLDEALDECSPDRIARNEARERWLQARIDSGDFGPGGAS